MSQPFDRSATCEPPGELDPAFGEFWVKDPFQINFENNLSSYERNRAYLNLGGKEFLEISHLTGADSDGDGRAAVAADLDGDGREDLIVRQSGGGPLLIFDNHFPSGHWVEITLRGTASNRLGIGARLEATVGGRRIFRDQFPVNSYRSQAPNRIHFGIGDADQIDQLTIRWPSGGTQTVLKISADQHLVIKENLQKP